MKRVLPPIVILTVAYLAALALWPEALNHNSEYQWPVLRHGVATKLLPACVLLLIVIGGVLLIFKVADQNKIAWFEFNWRWEFSGMALFLAMFLLQIIPMTVHRMGLLEFPVRVYLPDYNSYFTDAVELQNQPTWLRDFPELVPKLHTHSRTHPPGVISNFKILIRNVKKYPKFIRWYFQKIPRSQEAAERFHLRPAEVVAGGVAAGQMLLAAGATLLFLMALFWAFQEKQIFYLLTLVMFAFSPTFSNKTPVMDQAFAAYIIMGVGLFLLSLKRPRQILALASGLILSYGLFYSYTFLAAFPLVLVLFIAWRRKNHSAFPPLSIVLFCAGVLLWLSYYFGKNPSNPIEIYKANLAGWHFNNTVSGRIHMWKWILFDPYEFFAWLGVPIFLFFALAVGREIKKAWLKQWDRIDPFTWAIVIFGIALDLSGRVCYESPRLAWFYAPLVCLVAAKGFTETDGSNRAWPLALVLVLQAATVLVFRMLF